jgi:NIMA (never in mitosis gene a)-related kinase
MEELQEIQLLGSGSFGKCYLCIDPQDNSKVVVKQIDISHMNDSQKRESYHEAKIMSAFDHPNIIRFRDIYATNTGKLNIVMDYADGGDLADRIKNQKGKYFQEVFIIDIFVQLCLALKHVHDRKILHRDIKAQNVFLTKDDIVKLGDFGIARVLSSTIDKAKTVVGTPYYLSPEIVDNKPYNFKSDVWSLGVLLYELCTLKPPFDASSFHFLALKIVRGAYPPLPPHYSRDLKTLVAQMLCIDPNKRPSIAGILKVPFINRRIKNLLTESINLREFSHTILHNEKFVDLNDERPKGAKREERKPEEKKTESKPKSKPLDSLKSSGKKSSKKKPKEKVLTAEEKEKIREEKARKREEDRLKMREDIKSRSKTKNNSELVQWIGTSKEESRLVEELQAAADVEVKDDEILSDTFDLSMTSNEEIIYKEDVIKSHAIEETKTSEAQVEEENSFQINDRSTQSRCELLRMFLERKLGIDTFLEAYNLLKQWIGQGREKWEYEDIYMKLKNLMNAETAKEYLPLIHTLLVFEGESDTINLG